MLNETFSVIFKHCANGGQSSNYFSPQIEFFLPLLQMMQKINSLLYKVSEEREPSVLFGRHECTLKPIF